MSLTLFSFFAKYIYQINERTKRHIWFTSLFFNSTIFDHTYDIDYLIVSIKLINTYGHNCTMIVNNSRLVKLGLTLKERIEKEQSTAVYIHVYHKLWITWFCTFYEQWVTFKSKCLSLPSGVLHKFLLEIQIHFECGRETRFGAGRSHDALLDFVSGRAHLKIKTRVIMVTGSLPERMTVTCEHVGLWSRFSFQLMPFLRAHFEGSQSWTRQINQSIIKYWHVVLIKNFIETHIGLTTSLC